MEVVFVVVILASIWVSVGRRAQREDPLYSKPVVEARRQGPKINQKVQDPAWADAYVGVIATIGDGPLVDTEVRKLYAEIVNNDELSQDAKYYMLDGLYQRTMNDHPRGMGADVLEEISNESIALSHPDWHGRHRDWNSVKGR